VDVVPTNSCIKNIWSRLRFGCAFNGTRNHVCVRMSPNPERGQLSAQRRRLGAIWPAALPGFRFVFSQPRGRSHSPIPLGWPSSGVTPPVDVSVSYSPFAPRRLSWADFRLGSSEVIPLYVSEDRAPNPRSVEACRRPGARSISMIKEREMPIQKGEILFFFVSFAVLLAILSLLSVVSN